VADRWYLEHLACPDCRRTLDLERPCACGFRPITGGILDLRPQNPQAREHHFSPLTTAFKDLDATDIDRPENTYRGPRPIRDSGELFSAAEPWLAKGSRLIDLGCGPRDQAVAAEHYGLRYAGVDVDSRAADCLADAHALPFADNSFDGALAYAVLEHLHNPFVAASEAARVLIPGGVFFGTVSQGEPFHDSFFHHTAVGVLSLLHSSGFEVRRLWPSYDTLHALAVMGRYSKATRLLIEALYRFDAMTPFLAPRTYFRGTAREKKLNALHRAASICFVATKVTPTSA
jgi:SAM-dependent methyltransferase